MDITCIWQILVMGWESWVLNMSVHGFVRKYSTDILAQIMVNRRRQEQETKQMMIIEAEW